MNKKYKIIGFDGWTGGARHYARFVNHTDMEQVSLDFKLIHLGSWGAQSNCPKQEIIDGVKCFDISYYGSRSYKKILEKEKPDLVIFLSTHVFDHRAMIKQCNKNNIKTLHIFPGLLGALAINSKNVYKFKLSSHLLNVVTRLPKLIRYTFPNYISNLVSTKASMESWKELLIDLACQAIRKNRLKYSLDSTANRCLVYMESEIKIATDKYGYNSDDVKIIGLPDVTDFNIRNSDILSLIENKEMKKVVYFDTGYIYTGDVFLSVEEYVKHILNVRDELASRGLELIFKPKPQPGNKLKEQMLQALEFEKVSIYEGKDIKKILSISKFIMTEPSTIGLSAALMGLPIVLVGFEKFKGQEYGECLLDYPMTSYASSLCGISDGIDYENNKYLEDWLIKSFDNNPTRDVSKAIIKNIKELLDE
ncbi:hypothetical protein [Vibrio vulnificus]|uniref:hypothetical protein n=1 Tax=Vibrio vulnificus TaxID=672 RepID=UPI003ED9392D